MSGTVFPTGLPALTATRSATVFADDGATNGTLVISQILQRILLADLPASGATNGQVITWNGSAWVPSVASGGFSGSYTDLTNKPTIPVAGTGPGTFTAGDDARVTGAAPLASPSLTGVPSAPTASPGANTTQIATTAFVAAALTAIVAGVSAFNTRTGSITLLNTDVSGALGFTPANASTSAPLASPALTGTPTAPTAAGGTNTTQLATTAFVTGAAATVTGASAQRSSNLSDLASASSARTNLGLGGAAVLSVGTVTGTLAAGDDSRIVGAAPLASPALTGTPTAPTASVGTSTTQLATTGFVAAGFSALKSTRVVTAAGGITMVASDGLVVVNKTTGAATTVTLEASPTTGATHRIKDGRGDAVTNNITIVPATGTIDGAPNFVMNVNRMAVTIEYSGTEWVIV